MMNDNGSYRFALSAILGTAPKYITQKRRNVRDAVVQGYREISFLPFDAPKRQHMGFTVVIPAQAGIQVNQ